MVSRLTYLSRCFVLVALVTCVLSVAAAAASGFSPQARIGYRVGDQWEPALAADGSGHVYVLYPQYGEVPGCPSCIRPILTLVTSEDNGTSWQSPRHIAPSTSGQFDPQIVVDPVDRRTVYAAWLENNKTNVIVAKSADFGQSWSLTLASRSAETDKPILAVRGADVYVAFHQSQQLWVASSHDGGISFTSASVPISSRLNSALASGGTIDPSGTVYFAWSAYTQHKRVNLYVSQSTDGGKTWTSSLLDLSGGPPRCAAYRCDWAYLGAQITIASDAAGTLYALWNSGVVDRGPERIYFSSSTTAGATWSPKFDVSSAVAGVQHAFPTLVAGAAGDVRVAWMDTRMAPLWNTFYRSSTNGGATWSPESQLSGYVRGYSYVKPSGFRFPFGDYFGMDIDSRGQTHVVWGEGFNFDSPGSIWYNSGR